MNSIVNPIDLIDIFIEHLTQEHQKTHNFSSAHKTRIDHILHNKTNLNQFKRFEVIQCMFSVLELN